VAGLTAAQLTTLARQIARVQGMTAQSGQFLNMILADLCRNYDLAVARKTFNFNFTPASVRVGNLNAQLASGPITLPSDYLRAKRGDIMWFNAGQPMLLTPCDIEQFDQMYQQIGYTNYPSVWATDMSQTPPIAYVWPPASGSYPAMVRYYAQMPDIATPETSATVPWFPNQDYLKTALAGHLMQLANDDRWEAFLSDNEDAHPGGAGVLLRKYLVMKDDDVNRAKSVKLDPRRFGSSFYGLKNTKSFPWSW
jgi:hypothetical protein